MQGYAQEICRTQFFVGLRIEVDAPGVLAAIRPWLEHGPVTHSGIWSISIQFQQNVSHEML